MGPTSPGTSLHRLSGDGHESLGSVSAVSTGAFVAGGITTAVSVIAARSLCQYTRYAPLGPPPALSARLSRRQAEIALLIADGHCDKDISNRLGIATVSIRTYVRRIAKALELNDAMNVRIQITRVVIDAWAEADELSTNVA